MSDSEITTEVLGDALGLGRVPDDELLGVFHGVLPLSRFDSDESSVRVPHFHSELGHVLDVVYERGRIARLEPGPGLTRELVATLRERAELAFAADAGFEIWRAMLFSIPEVKGYWRHSDHWQILPAPPDSPRPDFLLGEHPFNKFPLRLTASCCSFGAGGVSGSSISSCRCCWRARSHASRNHPRITGCLFRVPTASRRRISRRATSSVAASPRDSMSSLTRPSTPQLSRARQRIQSAVSTTSAAGFARRLDWARTSACTTGVIGSGLELEGELIQLTAFTSEHGARAFGGIAR